MQWRFYDKNGDTLNQLHRFLSISKKIFRGVLWWISNICKKKAKRDDTVDWVHLHILLPCLKRRTTFWLPVCFPEDEALYSKSGLLIGKQILFLRVLGEISLFKELNTTEKSERQNENGKVEVYCEQLW